MALTMIDKQAFHAERAAWPKEIADEFARNQFNGCGGHQLVSEDRRVRVWTIRLAPGERNGFHRHVLAYFWSAITGGRARQHLENGDCVEFTYIAAETRHESYGQGRRKIHDLENIGDTELVLAMVEFLDSANAPLSVPDSVRPKLR